MMSMPMENQGWLAYVGVKDIQQSTDQDRWLGAIMLGPQEIPNIGWMTIFQDPTGCIIAIFQSK
jgi:predicted enzyme related to lactoylglutathione lyase